MEKYLVIRHYQTCMPLMFNKYPDYERQLDKYHMMSLKCGL